MKYSNLPSFMMDVIDSSGLKDEEREDLIKELSSHYFITHQELKQKNLSKDEAEKYLQEEFGNSQTIGNQIKQVHSEWSQTKRIMFYLSLSIVLSGPLLILITSAINIFTLCFLLVCIFSMAIIYLPLNLPSIRKDLAHTPGAIAQIIVSLTVITNWLALFFSQKQLYQNDIWKNPAAVAGFPFRALYYPTSPLGGDYVPYSMWPKFYANFSFWLVVAIIAYFWLPEKFKTEKVRKYLSITAGLLSMFGCLYLLMRFD